MKLFQILNPEGECVAEADTLNEAEVAVEELAKEYVKDTAFYVAEIKTVMSVGISRKAFLIGVRGSN